MNTAGSKIAIIGRNGQLARELQYVLPDLGQVTVVGRPEIDLAHSDSVRQMIRKLRPDILVNAGAYTAVDQAESEPELAMAVNAAAPQAMAEEAKRIGALFITYSTDYVFDGSKTSPYTELDAANPLNTYGRSKLAGDKAVEAVGGHYLIFRTSWVYGLRGKNFLRTMMALAPQRDEIRVVDDQIGAPTSSRDIAQATARIIRQMKPNGPRIEPLTERCGIYNMTSEGVVSWCGFATAIIDELHRHRATKEALAKIVPISTTEYPTAAVRPRNSRLSNEKIRRVFGIGLPQWKSSLIATMGAIEELERGGRVSLSR